MLLLFALLFGAIALILGQITKPLAALTTRIERFAAKQDAAGPLEPRGPDDVRRLIVAHNAMEARLSAMLDEKDVMLGAIGHDLKTPLAALRVRIESVDDAAERGKMARTIEDITRSLDDILSLARVGRPSDPLEPADLGALVAQVAEEFEDLGEPVTFTPAATRIVRGIVPQDPVLFSGTSRENILSARPDARAADVERAARAAHALEFIERLPNTWDTRVGERGVKLSGGQRQRIAIARVFLKNPAVVVLDEATSSLDTESEQLVEAALEALLKGRTTLLIAHRLSTVRRADRVVVLEAGEIVETGVHDDLMRREGGRYARLHAAAR